MTPPLSRRALTAWDISESASAKPLGKFGSASVRRVVIEPVRTRAS